MYSYEIEDGLTLKIWENSDKEGDPVLILDRHPSGIAWPSADAAIAWFKQNYTFDFEVPAIESTEEGTSKIIEETAE